MTWTGEPVRGRLAAWVALPRPQTPAGGEDAPGPRLAPGAVADALTTAFMLLPLEQIEAICAGSPGLQAWVLPEDAPAGGDVVHLAGPPVQTAAGHSA